MSFEFSKKKRRRRKKKKKKKKGGGGGGRFYGITTSGLKRMTLVWLKIIAPTVFSKKTALAKIDWLVGYPSVTKKKKKKKKRPPKRTESHEFGFQNRSPAAVRNKDGGPN